MTRSYSIRGPNYDTIIVESFYRGATFGHNQFYRNKGKVVAKDSCVLDLNRAGDLCQINYAPSVLVLPSNLHGIVPRAFDGVELECLYIPPDSSMSLQDGTFAGNTSIRKIIVLSPSVTYGTGVFRGCKAEVVL